jgi:hypothetical protein
MEQNVYFYIGYDKSYPDHVYLKINDTWYFINYVDNNQLDISPSATISLNNQNGTNFVVKHVSTRYMNADDVVAFISDWANKHSNSQYNKSISKIFTSHVIWEFLHLDINDYIENNAKIEIKSINRSSYFVVGTIFGASLVLVGAVLPEIKEMFKKL